MDKLQKAYRLYDPKTKTFICSRKTSIWLNSQSAGETKTYLDSEVRDRVELREYYLIETSRFSHILHFFDSLKVIFNMFQFQTSLDL